jgi:hypothetical protein
MRRGTRTGSSASTCQLTTILLTLWPILGFATAKAQNIVSRPSSFQAAGDQSFENQILDRFAQNGRFQPDDLPSLARLVVLESIAMHVDVRTDLAGTTAGNLLEPFVARLSETSELFYESVSAPTQDLASSMRSLQLFDSVDVSYRRVDSALGEVPGLSNQAADHLTHLNRLMAVMTPVVRELESSSPATSPNRPITSNKLASLQRQTRSLADDLVRMIATASAPNENRLSQEDAVKDLEGLLVQVQGFEHVLSLRPSTVDLEMSLHALRRQFWRVEATIVRPGRPAELWSGWRTLRERMNAISDVFGMPHVIVLGNSGLPVAQPTSVMLTRPIARIYRGSPGVGSDTASN